MRFRTKAFNTFRQSKDLQRCNDKPPNQFFSCHSEVTAQQKREAAAEVRVSLRWNGFSVHESVVPFMK